MDIKKSFNTAETLAALRDWAEKLGPDFVFKENYYLQGPDRYIDAAVTTTEELVDPHGEPFEWELTVAEYDLGRLYVRVSTAWDGFAEISPEELKDHMDPPTTSEDYPEEE